MVAAVRVHKQGGPEVLAYEDVDVPPPGPGELRVRQHAIGLNFIDTYFRSGLYKVAKMPFIVGNEGAGEVTAVGPGVTNFHVGDRVGYYLPLGCYAAERNVPAARTVKLPDGISFQQAAVLMLKGMTVQYLLNQTFQVKRGQTILIHAAAGGVGLIATQWAHALGATVIGTVGSKEKAELARANGCDHVILYREENFLERVKEITKGALCDVVYDSVGKDTFPASLDCIKRRGLFVSFGSSSGPLEAFHIFDLKEKGGGGLYATRPTLNEYIHTHEELVATADATFAALLDGKFKIQINHTYALKDARRAHEELEGRKTTGAAVLIP